jgi:hypothetical protein
MLKCVVNMPTSVCGIHFSKALYIVTSCIKTTLVLTLYTKYAMLPTSPVGEGRGGGESPFLFFGTDFPNGGGGDVSFFLYKKSDAPRA